MVDPLVALRAHVQLRAEGALVGLALGALVDQRALLRARTGAASRSLSMKYWRISGRMYSSKAQVADDRVVAQDGVARTG
jgi:hypothetical protein